MLPVHLHGIDPFRGFYIQGRRRTSPNRPLGSFRVSNSQVSSRLHTCPSGMSAVSFAINKKLKNKTVSGGMIYMLVSSQRKD